MHELYGFTSLITSQPFFINRIKNIKECELYKYRSILYKYKSKTNNTNKIF